MRLGENLNILPSGSVTPENAKKWLEVFIRKS